MINFVTLGKLLRHLNFFTYKMCNISILISSLWGWHKECRTPNWPSHFTFFRPCLKHQVCFSEIQTLKHDSTSRSGEIIGSEVITCNIQVKRMTFSCHRQATQTAFTKTGMSQDERPEIQVPWRKTFVVVKNRNAILLSCFMLRRCLQLRIWVWGQSKWLIGPWILEVLQCTLPSKTNSGEVNQP